MEGSPELRASDEQRERAAQQLRDHFAAGRLSEQELSERVQTAYGARTEAQLRELLADLPRLPASPQQLKAELAERRGHLRRRLVQEAGGGISLFVLCTVIWLASGASGQFWPVWVAILPVIMLLRNGWRLYGPDPQLDRVERALDRRARHAERRRHRHSGRL